MRGKPTLALASVLVAAFAAVSMPAEAACKKFGFTVNDYGKDGPTNDAKNLLDKHIAEWAAKNGVTAYQTGKKSVSCELFLDVILFDEHTCTASASVCWGDGVKPNNKTGAQSAESTPAAAEEATGDAPPAPVRKAEALGIAPQQAATAAAPVTEAAPATETAASESAAPVEQVTAPAEMPAATPAVETAAPADGPPVPLTTNGAAVETGALQAGAGLATAPSASSHAAPNHTDRAAAAQAAATAAAAAERAAVAAETAASAAKEAAAAAVAASAASRSTTATATVPPLGQAATHAE